MKEAIGKGNAPSKHLEDKFIKYEWKLVEYKAWNKHASTHVL
jgi:hypothetical protein